MTFGSPTSDPMAIPGASSSTASPPTAPRELSTSSPGPGRGCRAGRVRGLRAAHLGAGAPAGWQPAALHTGADGDADRAAFFAVPAARTNASQYLVAFAADGLATDDEFEAFAHRLSAPRCGGRLATITGSAKRDKLGDARSGPDRRARRAGRAAGARQARRALRRCGQGPAARRAGRRSAARRPWRGSLSRWARPRPAAQLLAGVRVVVSAAACPPIDPFTERADRPPGAVKRLADRGGVGGAPTRSGSAPRETTAARASLTTERIRFAQAASKASSSPSPRARASSAS